MEKHMFEELSFRKVFKFILALLLFSCGASVKIEYSVHQR